MNPLNPDTDRNSTFQTGIQFDINARGPGSINSTDELQYARITGPGLPVNGLVYIRPLPLPTEKSDTMDLFNKTGDLSVGKRCGNPNNTTFNCPNLWFARSKGIIGADASILTGNPINPVWTVPADNVNPAKFVKGERYKVELFYGSSPITITNATLPTRTFHKTLLSDLIQAERAVNLPWNTLGPQSLAALDPSGSLAGAQINSLPVDWVQNIAAQQIKGLQAVIDTKSGSFSKTHSVPKGATSAVLDDVTVPAFISTISNPPPPRRTLLLSYKMLDTSSKTSVYIYN
jgi:hypothetical protein